jgi:hypothetical protein
MKRIAPVDSCYRFSDLVLARIIHDAWASTLRKLDSLGYCSKFVVSTGHPRREIDEFEKLAYTSRESLQWANQTPVVVNNSGLASGDLRCVNVVKKTGCFGNLCFVSTQNVG